MNRYIYATISRFRKIIEIDSIDTLYLIGEFEDGVDYYVTEDGEITTTITGIYLGVGNSDGDIDLDIREYSVEITSPLASADIAIDVPFTFEATTNVQDGRTLHVVAYQGELSVVLDELTISGGKISGSVTVSESDGFTTGDVQLLAWYSPVVSTIDTVDVTAVQATITNVTSTPASPTEATNFELSGDSTYLVGKTLTLQYSTDDATWSSLETAVVQPDGTWSKDTCRIATAGSYYLRAVYDTDIVESESISVTVESGADSFLVIGDSQNLRIKKHSLSDFAYISKQATNYARAVCATKDYIFCGSGSTIQRLDKSNYANSITATVYNIIAVCSDENYVYFIDYFSSYFAIQRLTMNLTNSTTIHNSGLTYFASNYGGIRHYAGYLYFITLEWTGGKAYQILRKLKISDGTYSNLLRVQTSVNYQNICTDGSYLYLATADKLYKLNMDGTSTGTTYTATNVRACEVVGNYVYIALANNILEKLNKSDLTKVGSSYGSTGSGDGQFNDIRNMATYKG